MSKDNAHEVYIDDKGAQFILVNKERVYINDKSQEQINITKGRASSDRSLSEDPNDLIRLYNSDNSGQLSRIYWDTDDNLRWLVNTNDIYIHPEGGDGSGTVHLQTDLLVGDPNNPDAGGEIRHNGRINAKYNPQVGEPAHWLGTSYDGDNTYNLSSLDYMVINPPNGTTFDYFQRFRSEGQDKFKVSKEGKTTIRGDGTLLDLQDNGGSSKIAFSNGGYIEAVGSFFSINSPQNLSLKTGDAAFLKSNGNRQVLFGNGSTNNLSSRVTIAAKSGQTDPLLQLNDETGSPLITDEVSGDRTYHAPGKGVVLTSPDGSTKKRVRLDNNGDLVTETV